MAKYKLTDIGVYNTETREGIPNAPGNNEWEEYQEWLAEGNTPDPKNTTQELLDAAWMQVRAERDKLLKETDFMMLSDILSTYNSAEQTSLLNYRQGLRDVPQNTSDPNAPSWPSKPQIVIDKVG